MASNFEPEKEHNWSDFDKLTTVPFDTKRRFVCIEYPGIVENTEKALKTLGGTKNVNKTYNKESTRLPVYFRPDDVYCKPAFGERTNVSNLLLKVKVRRKKKGPEKGKCQYNVQALGTIEISYQFKGMSDFQFLAVERQKDDTYSQFLDRVVLNKFEDRQEFMNRDVPLYVPPVIFSRVDIPDKDYVYRNNIVHKPGYQNPDVLRPANLIGTVRERRKVYTIFLNFDDVVPEKTSDEAIEKLQQKLVFSEPEKEAEIERLFQVRPIWSRSGINHYFTGSQDILKYILPMKAFYYLNGPWRCLWVRFGYDPRKSSEAKMYQSIDFRMRQTSPIDDFAVMRKRGHNNVKFSSTQRNPKKSAIISVSSIMGKTLDASEHEQNPETEGEVPDHVYLPERLPPCRQMFYQLCDLRDEEIQDLLSSYTAKKCAAKSGWCSMHQVVRTREKMTENVLKVLKQEKANITQHYDAKLKRSKRNFEIDHMLENQKNTDDEEDKDVDTEIEDEDMETEVNKGDEEEDQQEDELDDKNMSLLETEVLDFM